MFLQKLLRKLITPTTTDILICAAIVFLVFSFSLNREWIFYDEDVIYNETYAPIPASFSEVFEILKEFGLYNNIGSSNDLYSSTIVNRTSILGTPLLVFQGYLFKTNAFLYHLLNLIFHLFNTALIYLILNKLLQKHLFSGRLLSMGFALLWALHPANVESVLLSTNFGALLSYFIYFLLFYDFFINRNKNVLYYRKILIPILFLIPMLINEYIIMLPLIVTAYSFITNYSSNTLKDTLKKTLDECSPYFIGLMVYTIYFVTSKYSFSQQLSTDLTLIIQRIFWLAPQIILHHLKIIFFPYLLSIDESAHVKLASKLFTPYSIFSILFVSLSLIFPLLVFLITRKLQLLTLTIWLLFISLLPFSQILSPTYALAAERYLYTPLFFIIFGAVSIISISKLNFKIITNILAAILLVISVRTITRIFDWKNSETLLLSTLKSSPDNLYKGFRSYDLAYHYKDKGKLDLSNEYKAKAEKYLNKAFLNYDQTNSSEPKILKAYGLDTENLKIKSIYQNCIHKYTENKDSYKECLNIFNKHIKNLKDLDAPTLELYANLILEDGNKDKAKEIFLLANDKYPHTPFLLLSLIRFERDIEHNLERTRYYLSKASKLYPYSKEILFEWLRYYQQADNLKEYSKKAYLYGLRAHSKFTYLEALSGFLILGNLNMARKTTEKLLQLDPSDPKIYYLAAGYHIKEQNHEKAIKLLLEGRSLLNQNQTDLAFKINNSLANLYLATNNYEQALLYTQEALSYAKGDSLKLNKMQKLIDKLGI